MLWKQKNCRLRSKTRIGKWVEVAESMNDVQISGHLYLHAVLTALEDLLKHTSKARKILGAQKFSVVVDCLEAKNKSLLILFENGKAQVRSSSDETADVYLVFKEYQSVVHFFEGSGIVLPKVRIGWRRPWYLITVVRLLLIMKSHLEPAEKSIEKSRELTISHARLLLGVGLQSMKELSEIESFSQRIVQSLPNGLALFAIEKETILAWIRVDSGKITVGKGAPDRKPDVLLRFKSAKTALSILKSKLPQLEAVGKTDLEVSGMIPLADGIGYIVDRLSRYIKV